MSELNIEDALHAMRSRMELMEANNEANRRLTREVSDLMNMVLSRHDRIRAEGQQQQHSTEGSMGGGLGSELIEHEEDYYGDDVGDEMDVGGAGPETGHMGTGRTPQGFTDSNGMSSHTQHQMQQGGMQGPIHHSGMQPGTQQQNGMQNGAQGSLEGGLDGLQTGGLPTGMPSGMPIGLPGSNYPTGLQSGVPNGLQTDNMGGMQNRIVPNTSSSRMPSHLPPGMQAAMGVFRIEPLNAPIVIEDEPSPTPEISAPEEPTPAPEGWEPPLPPPGPYNTFEEADRAVKEFGLEHGFAMGSSRSETLKGPGTPVHKVWRPCACGGKYKPKTILPPELRRRGSKKVGCPYNVVIKAEVCKGVIGTWRVRVIRGRHVGHPYQTREELVKAFPQARRLTQTPEVLQDIHNMIESGKKPREILEAVSKHATGPSVHIKDINNLKSKTRFEQQRQLQQEQQQQLLQLQMAQQQQEHEQDQQLEQQQQQQPEHAIEDDPGSSSSSSFPPPTMIGGS
ncbi:hypothetical protein DFS34DRAFT_234534 [Phlyctochytrium arcticum]|nr:hypothetical protein DFS34DRAFT_234534 [Phlyctochytrium arcticum]